MQPSICLRQQICLFTKTSGLTGQSIRTFSAFSLVPQ